MSFHDILMPMTAELFLANCQWVHNTFHARFVHFDHNCAYFIASNSQKLSQKLFHNADIAAFRRI